MFTPPQPVIASVRPAAAEPWNHQQEEGVLRDVLEELDRERTKRAELEAQVKKLTSELATSKTAAAPPPSAEHEISRTAFVSMESQVKGFKELVEALTMGNPAIAAASKAEARRKRDETSSLPVHVVRLLEVMPWDSRSQEHIFGYEQVFEWQVYREQKWQGNMRFFSPQFKNLPVVKDGNGGKLMPDNQLLVFLAGGGEKALSSPSKYGVLTDEKMKVIYKIEDGYPLPSNGGTWEWVGGWRVDKQMTPSSPCDANGWAYAAEASHFLQSPDLVVDQHHNASDGVWRNFRRRKWSRRRVLVDYPLASERTRRYLKLLVENARLSVTTAKLSEQVGQTKTALTETEMKLAEKQAELAEKQSLLQAMGMAAAAEVVVGETKTVDDGDSNNPIQEFLANNEQVKEIGSKITNWVKKTRRHSEDALDSSSTIEDDAFAGRVGIERPDALKFQWKTLGRGGLMEKLARPNRQQKPRANSISTVETRSTVQTTEEASKSVIEE